ncbi:DNA-deoxyinosine glycosylase [Massilia sp. W12]|uniref:DNA-deoxyinosine glycosylase n=1 Tax=Massilia sp. W12 TaxID=3126507 RepID=UPI0030CF628D
MNTRLICFPPVFDGACRLLILGSFPGLASLKAQQYYAHPRNQFWPILGRVLGEELAALPYAQRLPRLLAHGVGVWDVYAACQREGSLDADIKQGQANDFAALQRQAPHLRAAFFNGREAGRFAPQLQALGWHTAILPSTSPAHAGMSFENKLQAWRSAFAALPDRENT